MITDTDSNQLDLERIRARNIHTVDRILMRPKAESVSPSAVFRIRIRIDFGQLDPDSDPGGQKLPIKNRKSGEMYYFEELDVFFQWLEASLVAWTSFMEA